MHTAILTANMCNARHEYRNFSKGVRDAVKGRSEDPALEGNPHYMSGYREGLLQRIYGGHA